MIKLLFLFLMRSLCAETDFQCAKEHVLDRQENHFLKTTDYTIASHVNPVTGEYSDAECDLVVAGIQPLSIRRFYNHCAPYDRRYGGWRYNPETFLAANFEWQGQERFASVGDVEGSVALFSNNLTFSTQKFATFHAEGQTHPLNIKIDCEKRGDPKDKLRYQYAVAVTDGSGRVRSFLSPMHRWNHPISWKERSQHHFTWTTTLWKASPHVWTPYLILKYL